MIIPTDLVEYFISFIEAIHHQTKTRLYRYATPPESPFWVAVDGFKVSESEQKKMCMTLSPVFYTYVLGRFVRGTFIVFGDEIYDLARATSYTAVYPFDPISREYTYPYEMELSIYYNPALGYTTDFVSIDTIKKSYMLRGVKLDIRDYKKAKILPEYLHNRVYGIYPYTLISSDLLKKQVAILTIVRLDNKMRLAFSYAWDKYWDGLNKLAVKPNYEWVESLYNKYDFQTIYDVGQIKITCSGCLIPPSVANDKFIGDVVNIVKNIYNMVDTKTTLYMRGYAEYIYGYAEKQTAIASEKGLSLYYKYSNIFNTPDEAERAIKWWFSDIRSLENYLKALSSRYYKFETSVDNDPEAILEQPLY